MIFDTHAHYDDEQFAEDREQILASLFAGNVGAVVDVSAELDSAERVLELAGKYPQMYAAVGVHPDDVGEMSAERLAQIERLCAHEKCVAVGEIGLDYHWMVADKKTQAQWFAAQIELAK
ncbi:MAG: TatD family hydrolase, partial [Lachnospiraceae bacterium]|nr:TatD family hydrolase [Lachnospiraceae bacterium]